MRIKETHNKRDYMPLLLLADEQESMIARYLDRGIMYVMEDQETIIGVCVVTDEGDGLLEIQNLAIAPAYQGQGYGREFIAYISARYCGQYTTLQVATGDSPLTVPFYEHCGFTKDRILKNYIIDHYDHPIFEGGKQLIDKVILRKDLNTTSHHT